MDYIGHLIKAHRALLNKLEQIKAASVNEYYYEKYTRANSDNANLKEEIAAKEGVIFNLNKELNRRNQQIAQLTAELKKCKV